jgi:hypothetical protein
MGNAFGFFHTYLQHARVHLYVHVQLIQPVPVVANGCLLLSLFCCSQPALYILPLFLSPFPTLEIGICMV